MARTHFVKTFRGQRKCQYKAEGQYGNCGQPKDVHANLDHEFTQTALRCDSCGQPIEIGMGYKWVAPRAHRAARGHKRNRHLTCPSWRPSELTSSPHLATIYAAQEAAEDEIDALAVESFEDTDSLEEALQDIANSFGEAITEAAESYGESATNIEDGFGHSTYQSEELQEKADAVEGWANDAQSWTPESFTDEPTCVECDDAEEDHDNTSGHDFEPDLTPVEDWLDEQKDSLRDVIQDNPV